MPAWSRLRANGYGSLRSWRPSSNIGRKSLSDHLDARSEPLQSRRSAGVSEGPRSALLNRSRTSPRDCGGKGTVPFGPDTFPGLGRAGARGEAAAYDRGSAELCEGHSNELIGELGSFFRPPLNHEEAACGTQNRTRA